MSVGVLALQGSSRAHEARLRQLGCEPRLVRSVEALVGLRHLVIPGGESTTLHHLLQLFGMWEAIAAAVREGRLAVFGTCAGAILLGRESQERPPRWGLLDAAVSRNSYGRQIDSFAQELSVEWEDGPERWRGVFIRAPRFRDWGPEVRVLARCAGEAVLLEGPGVLAASFHPELTEDAELHRYFLERVPLMGHSPATPLSSS